MKYDTNSFSFSGIELTYYSFYPTHKQSKPASIRSKKKSNTDKKTGSPAHLPVLFFHATGYSALSYMPLFRHLIEQGLEVHALDFIGHGASQVGKFRSWYDFRDQVFALARHLNLSKVYAAGHSLGGASTLLAAAETPELFQKIAALDPVVMTPLFSYILQILPNPMVRIAKNRRSHFKSLELVRRSYRLNPAFLDWHEESFQGYLDSAFRKVDNGYELCLPPAVEAKVFSCFNTGHWRKYDKLKIPLLVISREDSLETPPGSCRRLIRSHAESSYISRTGTHFFPMEDPVWTAQSIVDFFLSSGSDREGI